MYRRIIALGGGFQIADESLPVPPVAEDGSFLIAPGGYVVKRSRVNDSQRTCHDSLRAMDSFLYLISLLEIMGCVKSVDLTLLKF